MFKFRDLSFGNYAIRSDLRSMYEFIKMERALDAEDIYGVEIEVFFNEFETRQIFIHDLDFGVDLEYLSQIYSVDFDLSVDTGSFYTIIDDFVYDDDFFIDLYLFCIFIYMFFSFYSFLVIYSIIIILIDNLHIYSDEKQYENWDYLYDDYELGLYSYSTFFFEDISYEDFIFFSKINVENFKNGFFFSKFKGFCKDF